MGCTIRRVPKCSGCRPFAAITAASASTVWMALLGAQHMLLLGIILTILVFFTHRANIERLRADTEPKIGEK